MMTPFCKSLRVSPIDPDRLLQVGITSRHINGYEKKYELIDFDLIQASLVYDFVEWNGNQPAKSSYVGCEAAFLADGFWSARVTGALDNGKLPGVWLKMMDSGAAKAWVLPLNLLHADILPALSPGDELYMRVVCYTDDITYYEHGPDTEGASRVQIVEGELLPWGPFLSAFKDTPENKIDDQKVQLTAKILDARFFQLPAVLSRAQAPFVSLTVQTNIGSLAVVHSLENMSERQRSLIKAGNQVNLVGWLVGDAASGEYAGGARYDLVSDLRVLADCISKRSNGRAVSIFADDCEYYSSEGLRATGPQGIVAELERVSQIILQRDYDLGVDFGRLVLAEGFHMPGLENGEPCLVFLDPDKSIHSLMFVKIDMAGKIARMETRYEFEEGASVLHNPDWRILTMSLAELLKPREEKPQPAQEPRFFESPQQKARIHGDVASFTGEPYFSFGDMWDVVDPQIQSNVQKFAAAAQVGDDFRIIGSETQAFWLDYPAGEPVVCRIIVAREEDRAELVILYPIFAGLSANVRVEGRYDWENGVCGFISASFANRASIDFFAPSYGLNHEKFVPGEVLEVKISGIAFTLEKAERDSFKIETGPMYEIELARFLQENPGKTVTDFDGVIIQMADSVLLLPEGTTCFYELSAKILRIAEVEFAGRTLLQLALPIARLENDEDVVAYLYAAKADCPALKAGDRVNCVAWLCADLAI